MTYAEKYIVFSAKYNFISLQLNSTNSDCIRKNIEQRVIKICFELEYFIFIRFLYIEIVVISVGFPCKAQNDEIIHKVMYILCTIVFFSKLNSII